MFAGFFGLKLWGIHKDQMLSALKVVTNVKMKKADKPVTWANSHLSRAFKLKTPPFDTLC